MKLKSTQVKQYRETQLAHQNHKCALCGEAVHDDAVLDHCHKTGLLRKVLHRGCNTMLGKIENNMPRSQMTRERLEVFASNLFAYISTQHTEIFHPTHKTAEEKRLRANKRARIRRKRNANT